MTGDANKQNVRSNSPCCALRRALAFKLYVHQGTRAITAGLAVVGIQPSCPGGGCQLGGEEGLKKLSQGVVDLGRCPRRNQYPGGG